MIVRDSMNTQLVTVEGDDTVCHAATLFRHYQFHHLPVVRTIATAKEADLKHTPQSPPIRILEGLITSQDIEFAAECGHHESSSQLLHRPWQEQPVREIMHEVPFHVTSTTSVGAAAHLMVERNLHYLPVVEYEQKPEGRALLVGLITRSDLLTALAHMMGTFEPGMQLDIMLPVGNIVPLAEALHILAELHIHVRSIIAAPAEDSAARIITLRIATINPSPLFVRLRECGILYTCANELEGATYA